MIAIVAQALDRPSVALDHSDVNVRATRAMLPTDHGNPEPDHQQHYEREHIVSCAHCGPLSNLTLPIVALFVLMDASQITSVTAKVVRVEDQVLIGLTRVSRTVARLVKLVDADIPNASGDSELAVLNGLSAVGHKLLDIVGTR